VIVWGQIIPSMIGELQRSTRWCRFAACQPMAPARDVAEGMALDGAARAACSGSAPWRCGARLSLFVFCP